MMKKSDSREKISHDKVPTAIQQYQLFKQHRIQLRKAKDEKRFDKIEEARKKECRNRLRKERFCAEISQYSGLWLKEEKIDAKLTEMRTDSEKTCSNQVSIIIQAKSHFNVFK